MPSNSIARICEVCNAEFRCKPSQVAKGGGRYCGNTCRLKVLNRRTPIEERFWRRVQKTDTCWLWTGPKLPKGYGRLGSGGDSAPVKLAHRYSWELHFGDIPDDREVCHTCDNPSCVKPEHLWLGTHAENQQDMSRKGRSGATRHPERLPRGDAHGLRKHPESILRGARNPRARLTEDQVRMIRQLHAEGIAVDDLATRYEIHRVTVEGIIQRKSWRHI